MFEKRMREGRPVYLHEFLYPLMQGYDSVALGVDGEVGGNDQTYNMLAGRHLMKIMQGKEKIVIAMKLLTDAKGKKMGKSEGNMIAFSDSPEDMFGKVMSWPDSFIFPAFELCTRAPLEKIAAIKSELDSGANPRDLKLRLAEEITGLFLGKDKAVQGRKHFETVIQRKGQPSRLPVIKPSDYKIASVLVESGLASSRSQVRRLVEQGGIKVNGTTVKAWDQAVKPGSVVQKGKRFFVKVK